VTRTQPLEEVPVPLPAPILEVEHHLGLIREQALQAADQLRQTEATLDRARRLGDQAQEDYRQLSRALAEARQEAQAIRQEALQALGQAREAAGLLAAARADFRAVVADFQEAARQAATIRQATNHLRPPQEADAPPPEPEAVAVPPARETAVPAPIREVPPAPEGGPLDPPPPLQPSLAERLILFLNDAWAVETAQADTFAALAVAAGPEDLRAVYEACHTVTRDQQAALAGRMQALGKAPSPARGTFSHLQARLWDTLHRPQEGPDRAVQELVQCFSNAQFQIGLYEALRSFAATAGDEATAQLAARHLAQEGALADRLGALLGPAAARAASPP
jgi:ferritin-like metal-binding protein YciE